MSAVPIKLQCFVYPKNKTVAPFPATIVGLASIPGLEIGGGPILPPEDLPPKPPGDWEIWGGPIDPYPGHPLPEPPDLPDLPPDQPPTAPTPPHEGWNWSDQKNGWYYLYVPGTGEAQPKGRR